MPFHFYYTMFIMYAWKCWKPWFRRMAAAEPLLHSLSTSHFKVWFMHGDTIYCAWNQMIQLCAWDSGILCGYAAATVKPSTSSKKMSQLAGLSETKTFDYTLQATHYAFSVDNRSVLSFFLFCRFSMWSIWPHAQPVQPNVGIYVIYCS